MPLEREEQIGFFVDPSRCIGCKACMAACSECGTHKGKPMIHVDSWNPQKTTKAGPTVCMHCDDPACAAVCPADAIKRTADRVVHAALKTRCIGCSNCQIACPFGVPLIFEDPALMIKCDLCYDRTSEGLKPMCATVCPSETLFYGRSSEIEGRRNSQPINQFRFGSQIVTTKVHLMVKEEAPLDLDIMRFMNTKLEGNEPWV